MSARGCRAVSRLTARGSSCAAALPAAAIRSRPLSASAKACIRSPASAISPRMSAACPAISSPAGVTCMLRAPRSNNCTPIVFSRFISCWEMAEVV